MNIYTLQTKKTLHNWDLGKKKNNTLQENKDNKMKNYAGEIYTFKN